MALTGIRIDVLERITTFTTLGLRFWDPALDQQIADGLVVTAWPSFDAPRQRRVAARSFSGIYFFQGLPGLRDIEHGLALPVDSPSPARRFVIEVVDERRRYADVAFEVELPLPYRGVYLLNQPVASPAQGAPRGVLLYSAPARSRPTWFGAVRGELAEAATGLPASHALVAVTDSDGEMWHGIADAAGRFTVWLAYPTVEEQPATSPQTAPGQPLLERSWTVRVEVFYSPATRRPLPGTATPEYESVLSQTTAEVWNTAPDAGGVSSLDWLGELRYGQEVVARTEGAATLLVGPE